VDNDPIPHVAVSPLGRAKLDELLQEVLQRIDEVVATHERLGGLLDAVVSLVGDLDLDSVLQRIVTVAGQLAGAKYVALGVLGAGPDRRLREFVTYGLPDEERTLIGDLPRGHGILGVLIDRPEPLRLNRIQHHPASYGFPAGHPPMGTFLGTPIRIRDKVFGNLYLTEKQMPGGFTEQDEELVVALAAAAGVVIENARLHEEAARRQRWLEAAADITAALLGPIDQAQALRLVADRAREAADADLATILLADDDRMVVEVVSGVPTDGVVGLSLPADTVAGTVLRSGQVLVVEDVAADVRASADMPLPLPWSSVGPLVLLPLRTHEGVDGVLAVGWAPENEQRFRDVDMRLPAAFAEQAALALHVARMQQNQALLAVFEDRDRIGRDLHDLVIQRLFGVGLALEGADLSDPVALRGRLSTAVDDIDETIRDIRRTIFEISSPQRSPQLRRLVGDIVADTARLLGFEPSVRLRGPVDTAVVPKTQAQLLATLREALSNVVKHADAAQVEVDLFVLDDVVLTVRDDGRGFEPGDAESGLRNMRERATSLGGTCTIRSGPGTGTELVWTVPLVVGSSGRAAASGPQPSGTTAAGGQ
jgi:signal transduction histidine kinase